MIPVPGIIGSSIHIQCIIAGINQDLRSCNAFLDILSDLRVFLLRQTSLPKTLHTALQTVAQRYRKVRSADLFDSPDNLCGNTQTVFQRAAEFITAFIKQSNGELIQQVAFMHRMDFHTVKACLFRNRRRFDEAPDQIHDFLFGHFTMCDTGIKAVGVFTWSDMLCRKAGQGTASQTAGQL